MGRPQLEMRIESLDGVPEPPTAPAGYALRTYREGDAPAWCRLVAEGIGGEYRPEGFLEQISDADGFDPKSLFFAVDGAGEPVGTACAIHRRPYPPEMGYVHMVAVDPAHRGRGLGRLLLVAVLRRMRDKGDRAAVLTTDDFRLPAISLYLSLGFRPSLTHESHPERWREVYRRLGRIWSLSEQA